MGCSTSKLDDEDAVLLCKDRKRFIKQAVEQRLQFASRHIAYIQSLRKMSAALHDYIEGDGPHGFLLDSYSKSPFMAMKKTKPGCISAIPIQSGCSTSLKINYLRSGGNPAIVVEERPPPSPETHRIETYPPVSHYGIDGFFDMQSSPISSSFLSTQNNGFTWPPPSPQTSQWDFFWNPFTSLDNYGYPSRSDLDQIIMDDDDISGLRQVREEEGIPDLEEDESEHEETDNLADVMEGRPQAEFNCSKEEVIIEDEGEDDEDYVTDSGSEVVHEVKELQPNGSERAEVLKEQTAQVEASNPETSVGNQDSNEETPGFTVYVKRRPTSFAEVIKDLESQFTVICQSANEVSAMLETSKAQYAPVPNELTAIKMLNPVALIRSASSRSSSSRFLTNSSNSRDESYEGSSDFLEEPIMFSGSHQSSLGKLYVWEKKLYEEVKSGERFRIQYEKKHMQLRNQDAKGVDPTTVDKTRLAMGHIHTQMTVSLQRIEVISKRIEALRDEELQPQLIELIHRLARMWRVMAECHQSQKQTLDNAKHLLKQTRAKTCLPLSTKEPHQLSHLAANLEDQIRNWRACFRSWITTQRSYVHALTGWLLRCIRSDPETSRLPHLSPPIISMCVHWSRFLDTVRDAAVYEGLEFFASGMSSLYAQHQREESRRAANRSRQFPDMEMVEFEEGDMEKMVEVVVRVILAGLSVATASLAEFAMSSADAYNDLVKQWERLKKQPQQQQGSSQAAAV